MGFEVIIIGVCQSMEIIWFVVWILVVKLVRQPVDFYWESWNIAEISPATEVARLLYCHQSTWVRGFNSRRGTRVWRARCALFYRGATCMWVAICAVACGVIIRNAVPMGYLWAICNAVIQSVAVFGVPKTILIPTGFFLVVLNEKKNIFQNSRNLSRNFFKVSNFEPLVSFVPIILLTTKVALKSKVSEWIHI